MTLCFVPALMMACVLPLAGCRHVFSNSAEPPESRAGEESGKPDPRDKTPREQSEMDRLLFLERGARSGLEVIYKTARRNSIGLLTVNVILRNRSDDQIQIEGRVRFYDQYRVPSDGPLPWSKLVLPPHTTGLWEGTSTRVEEASYYTVEFRAAVPEE